jgi:PAS domain S-box-containing protein
MTQPLTPSPNNQASSPQEPQSSELLQHALMKQDYYDRIYQSMPVVLALIEVINYNSFRVVLANKAADIASGYEAITGMVVAEMFPPEELAYIEGLFHEALDQQTSLLHRELMFVRDSGEVFWLGSSIIAICNVRGHITHLLLVSTDTTRERRAELAEQEVYEKRIEERAAGLAEPEVPFLPINETTILFPLVGLVDLDRLERLMESLQRAVQAVQPHTVIIDITGMPIVDGSVAQSFLEAAKLMRSLGIQIFVSGVRPEIDREMDNWPLDLRQIRYFATLQQALEVLEETATA